jgi:RNA-directed DNA polymerase
MPDQGHTAAPEAERTVSTKLAGLDARARKETQLTNVIQFVDEELLHLALRSLRKQAAAGVDGQSYEAYAANAEANLTALYARLRSGRYRAPAVRRVYIPKASGGQRPLGIPTVEDRVVQKAVAWVLSAVYEGDFLESSHGFRPGRSAHSALRRLREGVEEHRVRWVVEVDVAGYFDHVNHEWLRKMVQHRVNDGGLLRLLGKWLRAGVMEQGVVVRQGEGTPQGGPVSPVLANIYLHYVLDQWFERRFRRGCRQWAELTRYADDFVAVFEDQGDAEDFQRAVTERLAAYGLAVSPEKTGIVPFDRDGLGGGRTTAVAPKTFSFLGFTHYLKKSRWGKVTMRRTPSRKKREAFLHRVAIWLSGHRHLRGWVQQVHLASALRGYYQYFSLRFCVGVLESVQYRTLRLWQVALRRRSERATRHCDWETLSGKPWFRLPRPRLLHAQV